jgi:hypothetical protein
MAPAFREALHLFGIPNSLWQTVLRESRELYGRPFMSALDLHAIEEQRLAIQVEIDSAVSSAERNRAGQFATPSQLARSIARCTRSLIDREYPLHFCDPALGTGAFFHALLAEFPRERIASASGIELQEPIARAAEGLWGHLASCSPRDFAQPDTIRDLPRPTDPESPHPASPPRQGSKGDLQGEILRRSHLK